MSPPTTVIRYSNHGAIELQIDRQGGSVQINCLMPPRGPGFFVVFFRQAKKARRWMQLWK